MKIETFTGGLASTNAYLVQTEQATILFDAPEGIYQWIQDKGIKLTHLILTHQHWDHTYDAWLFKDAKILAFSEHDEDLILQHNFRQKFGIPIEVKPFEVSQKLKHNEELEIDGVKMKVLHIPGHSPDSLAYYIAEENTCISGDLILMQSIGRIDLPGSSADQLVESIEKVMFKLPEETRLLTGHGPESTIETEKKYNAYKSIQ